MKRTIYCLSCVLLSSVVGCSEDSDDLSKYCGTGQSLEIITNSLTSFLLDTSNTTHKAGSCLGDEFCVYGYKQINNALELDKSISVCSQADQGKLKCNDVIVNALEDNNNCGACNNVCDALSDCKQGVCQKDSDSDGIYDTDDACPYNPEIKTSMGNARHCLPLNNSTYKIYNAHNLTDLFGILAGTLKQDEKGNAVQTTQLKIKQVLLENDINLADLPGTSTSNSCTINKNDLQPNVSIQNIIFKGQNHTIYAQRSKDNARCALSNALFANIVDCTFDNLTIDLDVNNPNQNNTGANAIFTNAINAQNDECSFSDVTISGSLNTQVLNDTGVGAFAGSISSENKHIAHFTRCGANNITVKAPKASNVGGIFGYIHSNSTRLNWGPHVNYIDTVIGDHTVGGAIGRIDTKNELVTTQGSYANFIVKNVSSENTDNPFEIGGYAGKGYGSYVVVVADHIGHEEATAVGGVIGKNENTNVNSDFNNYVFHINTLTGDSNIGGAVGEAEATSSILIHDIYGEVQSIHSSSKEQTIGGLVGWLTTSNNTSLSNITSYTNHIESVDTAAGLIGHHSTGASELTNISACANIYAHTPYGLDYRTGHGSIPPFTFNNVVVTSKRYELTNDSYKATMFYALSQTHKEGSASDHSADVYHNTYYSQTIDDLPYEKKLTTSIPGLFSYTGSNVELAEALANLGNNWTEGTCTLINEDGSTTQFKMPVYQQNAHKAALESLKSIVKEKGYFEL